MYLLVKHTFMIESAFSFFVGVTLKLIVFLR